MRTKILFIKALLFTFSLHAFAQSPAIETVIQRKAGGNCNDLTISSDGLLIAKVNPSLYSTEVEIWSTKTGHLLRVINTASSLTTGSALFNSVQTVRFYKGSSQILTGTTDGEHEIYDINTGKLVRKLPIKTDVGGIFAVCNKTGTMAALHIRALLGHRSLVLFDIFSNTAYDSMELRTDAITALEFSPKGDELAVGTKNGTVHLFNFPAFDKERKIEEVHDTAINFIQWTDDNYLLVSDEKIYTLWNLNTNKMQSNGRLASNSRIMSDPKEDSFYELTENKILKRTGDHLKQKEFGIDVDAVQEMAMDNLGKRLYVLTGNFIRVWDLDNLVQTDCIRKEQYFGTASNEDFHFIPGQRSGISYNNKGIVLKAIDTTRTEETFAIDSSKWNNCMPYINDLPAVSANGKIVVWTDRNKQYEIKTDQNRESILATSIQFERIVAATKRDSIVKFYYPVKGLTKRFKLKGGIDCAASAETRNIVAVGGDNLFLIINDNPSTVLLHDPKKETIFMESFGVTTQMNMPSLYTQLIFSPDSKRLYALSKWTGMLKVWNLDSKKIDTVLELGVDKMAISPDGKRLFAAATNEIIWINTQDFSIEAHTAFLATGDYISLLPNFYYKASGNGSKAVVFRKGMQTYGFDQFDIMYNRPDIVTKQLGNPSPQIVETLQKLQAKRWQRLNYSPENNNKLLLEAPEVTIKNLRKIPGTVTQRKFSFTAALKDKQTPLATVNLLINGVPALTQRNGTILQNDTSNHKEGDINFSVYLDSGNNVIEVYCTNTRGIESQRETFEVYYAADTGSIVSKTYFIGIGAGKYLNNQFDLKYPVKDVQDVAALFASEPGSNNHFKVKLLTDDQVTKPNVMALKKMLDSSSIDDKVIICWSGHGILNKSLDYYLATFDTDFNNPEQNAVNYADLATLLDDIPARKRVLFLDACHSGELDKDESKIVAGNPSVADTTAGTKSSIRKSGLKNTPALLNDMFADIRRNSGANIISAAGGAEYALESDTWKNGVFTFCLLDALGNRNADKNKDHFISIKELQNYLQFKVPELTQGRQKPTSRTENLVNDWIIW